MHEADNQGPGDGLRDASRDPDGFQPSTELREQRLGAGRSIRPGTVVPPTVVVADLGDGSLFVQGRQDGPSAYLSPTDAVPLRRELAAAFGSAELALRSSRGEAP